MPQSSWVHPKFDEPPVVETAFSVEFATLAKWQVPHFGLYWTRIRDRYPKLNVQAALPSIIEQLDESPEIPQKITFNIIEQPQIRCWFYNEPETQLIQIQNDRFIFNWKRGPRNDAYPHYENMRPVISNEWDEFRGFVNQENLGELHVRQCEITYVNHLEKGIGWNNYGDLGEVFPSWKSRDRSSVIANPEVIDINMRYVMPGGAGRLYVRAQSAIRSSDLREVIQLTLTTRGRPVSPEPLRIFEWFDDSQEFTARSFLEITSEKMQELWRPRRTTS